MAPGDVAFERCAIAAHDLARGVVSIAAPPRAEGLARFRRALLTSLGKAPTLVSPGTTEPDDLALPGLWLAAHAIRDLVIVQAQWLTPEALGGLAGLAGSSVERVWLLASPGAGPNLRSAVRALGLTVVDRQVFEAEVSLDRLVPDPEREPDPPRPLLGVAGLLDAGALAYRHPAFEQAAAWAAGEWFTDGAADPVARYLERALSRAAGTPERRAVVAGVAAGLRERGVVLERVEPIDPTVARLVDPALAPWSAITRRESPLEAGVAALTRLGLGMDEVAGLRVGDVPPDGSAVRVGPETIHVPREGRPCVAVLRLQRGGAPADAPLVLSPDGTVLSRTRLADIAHPVLHSATPGIGAIALHSSPGERFLAAEGLRLRRIPAWTKAPRGAASVVAHAVATAIGMGTESPIVAAVAASAGDTAILRRNHPRPAADHPWRRRGFARR